MKKQLLILKKQLLVLFCLAAFIFGGCTAFQGEPGNSIIVMNYHDISLSTRRIEEFDKQLNRACQEEANHLRDGDQAALVWFSETAQMASNQSIQTKLATRVFCRKTQPPESMLQVARNRGTRLSVALASIPTLSQQLRQQASAPQKAVLATIVIDAIDGESVDEAAITQQLAALEKNRIVTVALVTDSKSLNALGKVSNGNFQSCSLHDAQVCLQWAFRHVRSL